MPVIHSFIFVVDLYVIVFELQLDKFNNLASVFCEDSDQPRNMPSLTRDVAVHSMGS